MSKKGLVTSLIAAASLTSVFADSANAQQQQQQANIGLAQCQNTQLLEGIIKQDRGDVATNLITPMQNGQSKLGELRIYADDSDGSWTVLAKITSDEFKKQAGMPLDQDISCRVISSTPFGSMEVAGKSGYPDQVKQTPWYKGLRFKPES